jgi:hypothetical protein
MTFYEQRQALIAVSVGIVLVLSVAIVADLWLAWKVFLREDLKQAWEMLRGRR